MDEIGEAELLAAAGAQLHNPGGYTLNLVQANVKGSVRLADGFRSVGEVVLNRAAIEGRLICTPGTFDNPGPKDANSDRLRWGWWDLRKALYTIGDGSPPRLSKKSVSDRGKPPARPKCRR